MPDRRSGLLDFLTSDTSDDLTYRSSMLPIGTYRGDDGRERAGLAWPQLALDAVDAMEAPGELLFGDGLDRGESERRAQIAAGLMMGGGLAAPRPGNALAARVDDVVDPQPSLFPNLPEYPATTATTAVEPNKLNVRPYYDNSSVGPHNLRMSYLPEYKNKDYNFEFTIDQELATSGDVLPQFYPQILHDVRTSLGNFIERERPTRVSFEAEGRNALKNKAWQAMGESLAKRHGGRFETANKYDHSMIFDPDGQGFLFSNGSKGGAGVGGLMSLYGYDDEFDPYLNF